MVILRIIRSLLPVHDISTDYENLPQFLVGRQTDPQLVSMLKLFYSDVQPIAIDTSDAAAVYRAAVDAAKAMPRWHIIAEDQGSSGSGTGSTNGSSRSFQAVATTRLIRFKDDVVVRVAAVNGRVIVDTRSRSRVGQGDIGANGQRILQYQQKLRSLLAERNLSRL